MDKMSTIAAVAELRRQQTCEDCHCDSKVITEDDDLDIEVASYDNVTADTIRDVLLDEFVRSNSDDVAFSSAHYLKDGIMKFIMEYLTDITGIDKDYHEGFMPQSTGDNENYIRILYKQNTLISISYKKKQVPNVNGRNYGSYLLKARDFSVSFISPGSKLKDSIKQVDDRIEAEKKAKDDTRNKWNDKIKEIIDANIMTKDEVSEFCRYVSRNLYNNTLTNLLD